MDEKYIELVAKGFTAEEDTDKGIIYIKGYANRYLDNNGELVVDRSSEVVFPHSYELEAYLMNPILLYQHNKHNPIGKVVDVKITSEGLEVVAEVHKALDERAYYAVKNGIVRTFSIGFIAKDIQYDPETDITFFTKTELVEISVVSIPDNAKSTFVTLTQSPCGNGACLLASKALTYEKAVVAKAIKNNVISTTQWSSVDKTQLSTKLMELGNHSYIDEAYLVVRSYDKKGDWKFPHHELRGNDLVVNRGGVVSAYAALKGARNEPNITPQEKLKAARHLLKHYREMLKQEMIEEIPSDLEDMVKEFEELVLKNDNNFETKAASDIVSNNQNTNVGEQLQGGDKGELVVNVTENSVLTAYPNPPKGYRIRRYVKGENKTYEFIIGKSEVAALLAFMKKYFADRDDTGKKKDLENFSSKEQHETIIGTEIEKGDPEPESNNPSNKGEDNEGKPDNNEEVNKSTIELALESIDKMEEASQEDLEAMLLLYSKLESKINNLLKSSKGE